MKYQSFYLALGLWIFPAFAGFAFEAPVDKVLSERVSKVEVPVHEDTCFSPDEPCAEKLAAFLDSAQKTLDIAIYDLNIEELVAILIRKAKTLELRIVCDKKQARGAHSQIYRLLENGVNVRYGKQRGGVMHDKFVIVDGRILETGSFNYTNHARLANQENQVYLSSPQIVNRYLERYEQIWASSVAIDLQNLRKEITADSLVSLPANSSRP